MRVFVAGASGAIGSHLVPQLIERGHDVVGTHALAGRSEPPALLWAPSRWCSTCSTRGRCAKAVRDARPDAIVHQATALRGLTDFKHFDKASPRPTASAPRAPTRCSRPRATAMSTASSRRASPAGRTPARAGL